MVIQQDVINQLVKMVSILLHSASLFEIQKLHGFNSMNINLKFPRDNKYKMLSCMNPWGMFIHLELV
jgi:hypothetical protein